MENLINVGLYGDGSRDARRRAEYIYCDVANECSAYKEGKCFCVTTLFGKRCGVGTVREIDGGTKRSKAFRTVTAEAKNNPLYAKLKYPNNDVYLTKIGDKAFITLPYVQIGEEKSVIKMNAPGFINKPILVEDSVLTPENLIKIFQFRPQSMFGGRITDYQEKVIPFFAKQLKKLYPEKYNEFMRKYPDYQIPEPNYVGKYAKLNTVNKEMSYFDHYGNEFQFDGDFIYCEHYKCNDPFGGTGNAKETEIRIKVADDMRVKITDNAQVLETTVFV